MQTDRIDWIDRIDQIDHIDWIDQIDRIDRVNPFNDIRCFKYDSGAAFNLRCDQRPVRAYFTDPPA